MHGRLRPLVAATLVASLATSALPLTALAAPKAGISAEDRNKAIELFKQGQALQEQSKWDEALAKFEEVGKIVMTPGTRFNIALCKENLGRFLEALDDYSAAERDAKAEKKPEIEKKAHAAADALKERIPKIVLKVPSAVEGISITLDGKPIDPQNPELAVDPGKHKIEANAEKRVPFSADVTVAEKESKEVVIRLPEQPKEEPTEPPPPEPKKEEPSRTIPTSALIVGAAGVVSIIGAGIFYGLRGSQKSTLESNCNPDTLVCPPEQQSTIDSGKRYTTLGNVFLIVGVVGVGAGVVLWATAPKSTVATTTTTEKPKPPTPETPPATPEPTKEATPEPSASIRLVPYAPGADLGGIALRATF
jgi:hypothetical protein